MKFVLSAHLFQFKKHVGVHERDARASIGVSNNTQVSHPVKTDVLRAKKRKNVAYKPC